MTASPLQCWTDSGQMAVRDQLGRILASGPFLHSKRRQRFLEYIVSETLAGRGERLKGYSIATEVFDRPDDFDPNVALNNANIRAAGFSVRCLKD